MFLYSLYYRSKQCILINLHCELGFSHKRPSLFCLERRENCHNLHIVGVAKVCRYSRRKKKVFLSFLVMCVSGIVLTEPVKQFYANRLRCALQIAVALMDLEGPLP